MSDIQATLRATDTAFHVEGYEKIEFDLLYVPGAFAPTNDEIAGNFRRFGRCLMIVDETVHEQLYGDEMEQYFAHHGIELTAVPVRIAETEKSLASLERIVDAFGEFGLLRKEPVLVVGGGLTTDVVGFACSTYRRSTNYIRVPTTLIGLIDASVAIKVAVNHRHLKNRLGSYHPSQKVILDFKFLSTLPIAQVRNGMAELVKIGVVGNRRVFDLLDAHGKELLHTVGLAIDSPYLTPDLLQAATESIIQTRHGLLRAAVPRPIGQVCVHQRRDNGGAQRGAVNPQAALPPVPPQRERRRDVPGHRDGGRLIRRAPRTSDALTPTSRHPDRNPRRLQQACARLDEQPAPDPALAAELRAAHALAAGLEPYVARCTTPESPALAALAERTNNHGWDRRGDSGAVTAVEQEMLSGHVEGQALRFLVRMNPGAPCP